MSYVCQKVSSYPWIATCGAVLVLDVVASTFHIIDITNTLVRRKLFTVFVISSTNSNLFQDIPSFLDFIEIHNAAELLPHVQSIPSYAPSMPSLIMLLVSSRCLVVWVLNATCLIMVIIGVRKLVRDEVTTQKRVVRPDFGYEREYNNNNNNGRADSRGHSPGSNPKQVSNRIARDCLHF